MENASKALLIAGAVLLLMLVLSVGIYITKKMASQTSEIYKDLEQSDIDELNQKFFAYEQRDIYIQDVVSIINYAKNINQNKRFPVSVQVKIPSTILEGVLENTSNIHENAQNLTEENISKMISLHLEDIYNCTLKFGTNSQYIDTIEITEKTE